jgi:uncharacterized membrane protein HdeD (DUF308 family)
VALSAGIALAIAGIVMLLVPGLTLVLLVQFVGACWLCAGAGRVLSIIVNRSGWGWKLLSGLPGILAGIVLIQYPQWSALFVPATFTLIFSLIAIVIGMIEIVMAFRGAGWEIGILGAVSIVFGGVFFANPLLGAVLLPYAFGAVALIGGIVTIIGAFVSRSAATRPSHE